jgi:hypothetical protein
MAAERPLLSVVLATRERYSSIRKTVSCLRTQTACEQIELVIVAPSRSRLDLEERQLDDFAGYQVVEIDRFDDDRHVVDRTRGRARRTLEPLTCHHSGCKSCRCGWRRTRCGDARATRRQQDPISDVQACTDHREEGESGSRSNTGDPAAKIHATTTGSGALQTGR